MGGGTQRTCFGSLLDRLLGDLPVNPRLIILAGASMGAYATWDLLVRAPAIFAVGIPMSGGGDTKRASRITARVWAFHSRADRSVPVNASREIVDAVAAARNLLTTYCPTLAFLQLALGGHCPTRRRLPRVVMKDGPRTWPLGCGTRSFCTQRTISAASRCSTRVWLWRSCATLRSWTLE